MACLCKQSLASLTNPSLMASLNASLQASAALPPLPALPPLQEHIGGPAAPTPSLLAALQGLQIPPITLAAALPKLGAMVAAAITCKAQLGLPLPGAAPQISAMLKGFDPQSVAPVMSLNLNALLALQAKAAAALQVRAALGANPWEANLAPAFSAKLSAMPPPLPIPPLPQLPSPPVLAAAQQVTQISGLASLSASLGIPLAGPGGIAGFSAAISKLAAIPMPTPPSPMPPDLLPRLSALETINAAFGLNAMTPATLAPKLASLQALLSISPPVPPVPALAAKLPTMPQIHAALGLDLPKLAAVNIPMPTMPPLGAALPALSAAARLQAMAPVIKLSPCMAGCPMQALS